MAEYICFFNKVRTFCSFSSSVTFFCLKVLTFSTFIVFLVYLINVVQHFLATLV